MGAKETQPVKPMTAINAPTISPVAPFLPPFQARILDTKGFTAREIRRINRNDRRMGESSENDWMKAYSAAPRITYKKPGSGGVGFGLESPVMAI
jgi:hypothetical protein